MAAMACTAWSGERGRAFSVEGLAASGKVGKGSGWGAVHPNPPVITTQFCIVLRHAAPQVDAA